MSSSGGGKAARKLKTDDRQKLRAEAEARFAGAPPVVKPNQPAADLLYELQVHQIELEMQNEELRRSTLELQEAHDRYRKLYDYAYHFAPVGYFTLSDAGHILDLNLTAAGFLGEERKSVVGSPFPRFVAGDDADRWYKFARFARSPGDTSSIEVMIARKGRSPFPARLDVRMEDGDDGKLCLRVVLTDLTGSAIARDDLQESQDRISEFLAESRDGYWEWADGGGLVLSDRFREILGIEDMGRDVRLPDRDQWTQRVHPEDKASITNAQADLRTGREERCDIAFWWASPDKTWKPLRARGHVVRRTDAGSAIRIAGTVTDLGEPGHSRATLLPGQSRAALASTVVRNFPGGVIALFDGNLRYALIDGTGELDRPDKRTLISYVLLGDWEHEDAQRIEDLLRGALARKTFAIEVSVGGEAVEVRAGPVVDPEGSVSMGVATFRILSPHRGAPRHEARGDVEGSPLRQGRKRGRRPGQDG